MAERNSPQTSQNSVVKNQPPPFEDVNLFASDTALREAVARAGDDNSHDMIKRG